MSFLPKDYKAPTGTNEFMKLAEGSNRFRILTPAVIGWEGWKDGKPFRRSGIDQNITEDEVSIDEKYGKPKINHFWAFTVFDYTDKKVKLYEITQKTIMKAIQAIVEDEDWGNPEEYDIAIEKAVKGEKTSYTVKPYPHKPISKEIKDAFEASSVDPESLFKDAENDEEFNNYGTGKKATKKVKHF